MNKIKQNKITFTLILSAITVIFSSLTILCLPVLFNYKSKVTILEKNFYNNFKVYLKSSGKVSYKPFPKPHLLLENASLNLKKSHKKNNLINTSNLKIYISLRDLYLNTFSKLIATEISNTNIELKISDIKDLRNHLYEKINNSIILNNCKIFIVNKNDEVIMISPVKKISYKINNKIKTKNFIINGKLFGFKFKSEWKRNYLKPKNSFHNISLFNPNIEIKNFFEFKNSNHFNTISQITYDNDKLEYNLEYNNNKIKILSPSEEKTNYNLVSYIQLKPFFFQGELTIKNKKVEKIIDEILLNFFLFNDDYLGNFNGEIKLKFDQLKNKLINKGEINFIINEKKINPKEAKFNLGNIGNIITNISFIENNGEVKFISKNELFIKDHIEFAKIFQVGSKKIKNIKKIYFDVEKNIGETDFIVSNVKINNLQNNKSSDEIFVVKNIQNLRANIGKIID